MNQTTKLTALAVVLTAGTAAMAQTPLPLTNRSFEQQNLFSSAQPEGWHNLSNPGEAIYNKTIVATKPTPRTGNRTIQINAPARPASGGLFRGWTTDTVNDNLPTFPFYDPAFDWNGGDVTVTGYYLIPTNNPITEVGENVGIKLNVKLGNQDYGEQNMGVSLNNPDINIARLVNANGGPGHTNGQWVLYTVTWPKSNIVEQVANNESQGYFVTPPYPDHMKITLGRFFDFPNIPVGTVKGGQIYWDDMDYSQVSAARCTADYNGDTFLNLDDLGDFITDFYTTPPIPGGLQPSAPTYSDVSLGYGVACPAAPDAAAPYAVDALRSSGYRVGFSSDGGNSCPLDPSQPFPNLDNLNDYITFYYESFGTALCGG